MAISFRDNSGMVVRIRIVLYAIAVLFITYSIYLSAFLVLKGDVQITNDIGRDFLLLQELDQKKIVFIGARANTTGVFHGVFWTYLNYPAYLIGHGDPVVIAWFWVILGIAFLVSTFFIIRKILDTSSALLATAILSVDLIPRTNNIFGQEATFYFMPIFLFTIYMYLKSKKPYYLILHFLTVGIFVQLNIGVGGLFAILSIILSAFIIVKDRLWKHIPAFMMLPITLINYIIFDARHGFKIIKALLNTGSSSKFFMPLNVWMQNRIDNTVSMQLFTGVGKFMPTLSLIVFILMMLFTILEIKNKSKQKNIFLILAFYYFGYMILSYFNKGIMLIDYIYLLTPLSAIWLAALVRGSYKIIFIPIIIIAIYLNFVFANSYISDNVKNFIGKSPDSWVSLKTVAGKIIKQQNGKVFGYFVYSPDSFAYQQRYAMIAAFRNAHAKAFEYAKKSTTYVIAAPRPVNNPFMGQDWWIKNKANITILPNQVLNFPGGYTIEKFALSPEEQKIPFDPNIEVGLTFR